MGTFDSPGGRAATRSVPAKLSGTAGRVGVGLVWASAVVAAITALWGWNLAGRVDGLYMEAVEAGRAQIFTGEVDELSFMPVSVVLYIGFLACVNAVLAIILCLRMIKPRRLIRLVTMVCGGISVVVLAWTTASVVLLQGDQYVHDLYGWWFVPFYFAAAGLLGCLLVGAQIVILRVVPAARPAP